MLPKFMAIILLVLLSGCSSLRYHVNDPAVIAENQPIRHLPVKLIVEHGLSMGEAEAYVQAVSANYMMPQVGISLDICDREEVVWDRKEGPHEYLQDIVSWVEFEPDCDGIVICMIRQPPIEYVLSQLVGMDWGGYIDDTWRRFILINHHKEWVLAHEISHAFILSMDHSAVGLMGPWAIALLPFTPAWHDEYLSWEDREFVLKNKWRTFSGEPVM